MRPRTPSLLLYRLNGRVLRPGACGAVRPCRGYPSRRFGHPVNHWLPGSRPPRRAPSAHTAADGHAARMPRDCSHVNCFYRPMRRGVAGRFCVMWRPGGSRAQGWLSFRCIVLVFKFLHFNKNGNILPLNGKRGPDARGTRKTI